jgi:hypothetical protein
MFTDSTMSSKNTQKVIKRIEEKKIYLIYDLLRHVHPNKNANTKKNSFQNPP